MQDAYKEYTSTTHRHNIRKLRSQVQIFYNLYTSKVYWHSAQLLCKIMRCTR